MEQIKRALGCCKSSCKSSRTSESIKQQKTSLSGLGLQLTEETQSNSSTEQLSIHCPNEEPSIEGNFQKEKQTLVLDLDETLVHTESEVPARKFFPISIEKNGQVSLLYVVPRPGLLKFMRKMSEIFNICIYTCGDDTYAKKVVNATGINKYIYAIYSRNFCKKIEDCLYQKDLWSLGFNPQNTIFVDDFCFQTAKHCDNSIQIKAYEGSSCDRELKYLAKFLKYLYKVPDIRPISKHYDNFLNRQKSINEETLTFDELPPLKDDDLSIPDVRVLNYNQRQKI